MKPRIIVARHGATDLNRGGTGKDGFRGWLDVPLSEKGIAQARVLAKQLRNFPVSAIYSSDLQRTATTAKFIHEYHVDEEENPLALLMSKGFRPWNVGQLEGQPTTPRNIAKIRYYVVHHWDRLPGGEPFNDFVIRYGDALGEIMRAAEAGSGQYIPVIVAHARNLQLAELLARDGEIDHATQADELAAEPDTVTPGGYIVMEYDGEDWDIAERWPAQEGAS